MKVGDYIRTEKGIAKIIDKLDKMRMSYPEAWVTDTYLGIYDDTEYIYDEAIIKSSPNIIDLIQVGDIVNGWKVTQITNSYVEICWGRDSDEFIKPEEIKSIVTKEQFKDMEYEVE